jgi:hypothetical protein
MITSAAITRRIKKNLTAAGHLSNLRGIKTSVHAYDQWLTFVYLRETDAATTAAILAELAPMAAAEVHNKQGANCYALNAGTTVATIVLFSDDAAW